MRCSKCQGSGQIMGNGMIFRDCDCDDGETHAPKQVQIDKRSASYREAIKKIMQSGDCTREEAVKVFESEFDKIA